MLPEEGLSWGGGSLLLGPLPSSKRPLQALEKMVQGLEEARFRRSPGLASEAFASKPSVVSWAFPGTSSSL